MKSFVPCIFLASSVIVGGCSTMPISRVAQSSPSSQAEVLVFRESSMIAGGIPLTVGADSAAFAALRNGEYVRVLLAAGDREVFVRARNAKPTKISIGLMQGSTTCFRASASPSTIAKVIVPGALLATGYHFFLEEMPCPGADELAKYRVVDVKYASNES